MAIKKPSYNPNKFSSVAIKKQSYNLNIFMGVAIKKLSHIEFKGKLDYHQSPYPLIPEEPPKT